MNGLTSFLSDAKVHDTVLWTMVITSFLAAIRRVKVVTKWWQLLWNFFYDWAVGFWSMKTGQPLSSVSTQHIQTAEQTPNSSKIEDTTITSVPDPIQPVTNPAQTK